MKNGYDYAVIGGGSAGCVLAARLSEDPAVQVALVEAGLVDDAPEVHAPAMIYIRGNRADYDEWAADWAVGGFYDEMLPYFIKAEANERGTSRFHGA